MLMFTFLKVFATVKVSGDDPKFLPQIPNFSSHPTQRKQASGGVTSSPPAATECSASIPGDPKTANRDVSGHLLLA